MEGRARNPRPKQLCDVVDHDMQFAIVPYIEQAAGTAFVAAKSVVPCKIKENACSNPPDSDQLPVRRTFINPQNAHVFA
jgi:hypothetical protein